MVNWKEFNRREATELAVGNDVIVRNAEEEYYCNICRKWIHADYPIAMLKGKLVPDNMMIELAMEHQSQHFDTGKGG